MKKQLYTIFIVIGSCFAVTEKAEAQCTCSGGATPDSIVYTFTLAPTSQFTTAITFPRFNPAIGTLTCVSLTSDITAVSNLGILNRDSLQRDYEFLYTQAIGFSGPGGLNANATTAINYGPATLDAYGTGVDSVWFGPDTPFKNRGLSRTITNVAPYLGTGNVTINFTNTGSTLLLQGSNNYQSTVSTFAWGDFRLNYYWCPAAPLASGLREFTAVKKDNLVALKWLVEDELPNTRYEIQLSRDGRSFFNINGAAKRAMKSTNVAGYEFDYAPESGLKGRIFFRVKQVGSNGKFGYSSIRHIDLNSKGDQVVTISPNPIQQDMKLTFEKPQYGGIKVEVVNALGQAIYNKMHQLTGETVIELRLAQNTNRGVYYLRLRNEKSKDYQIQKIFIQ